MEGLSMEVEGVVDKDPFLRKGLEDGNSADMLRK